MAYYIPDRKPNFPFCTFDFPTSKNYENQNQLKIDNEAKTLRKVI